MIKKALYLLVSVTLVGSASAAWVKVDDYEDPATLDNWTVSTTAPENTGRVIGRIEYVDDPVASGQGKVLAIVNPIGADVAVNSSMVYPLGDQAMKDDFLNPDKKQTVYFKLLRPLVDGVPGELNTTIGFMSSKVWEEVSLVSPASNTDELAPSWGSYSSIVRYETDGIFDIRDASVYTNISDTAQDTNEWYEVWMVHSHGLNTFEVYLKGGSDYPEQTLVTEELVVEDLDPDTGAPLGTFTTLFEGNHAKYRVETYEDLDWFFIKPNGGGSEQPEGKDDTFIDDFYIDNGGENLSSPVAGDTDPLIGGTPIDGLTDWFLSDWFGAYNTTGAPWLFHADHGFLYRDTGGSNASMFVYDDAMTTWWWTNETVYPFLYAFDPPADNAATDVGAEWLFYFEGSKGPRSFGVVTGTQGGSFLFFNP